jgi:hypothetical protein
VVAAIVVGGEISYLLGHKLDVHGADFDPVFLFAQL